MHELAKLGIVPGDDWNHLAWEDWSKALERYQHGSFSTYIYPEESALLFAIAAASAPKRAVVLGSYYGYWAHSLLAALAPGGRATLVDPEQACQLVARRNLTAYEFTDRARIFVGTGEDYLARQAEPLDFAVLDADGLENDPDPSRRGLGIYYHLLQALLPRLRPGGILVCHNVLVSDASGVPFLSRLVQRTQTELSPFFSRLKSTFQAFVEIPTTQGVAVGIKATV